MALDEYSAGSGKSRIIAFVVVGAIIALLVVVIIWVGSSNGSADEGRAGLSSVLDNTTTSVPGQWTPADPNDTNTTIPEATPDGVYVPGEATPTTASDHDDPLLDGYNPDGSLQADGFEKAFPRTSSGLDGATFTGATAAARAFIIADQTGTGREQFPNYWPDNDPPITGWLANFTVDFAYASKVSNSALIRTVVVYHGQTEDGSVVYRQVQLSKYFEPGANGTYRPIQTANLPRELRTSDGLLSGVSFIE